VMTTGSVRFSIVSALLVRVPLFGLSGGRDLARSGAGSPAPIQGSLLFVGSSLADSAAPGGGDRTGQFVPISCHCIHVASWSPAGIARTVQPYSSISTAAPSGAQIVISRPVVRVISQAVRSVSMSCQGAAIWLIRVVSVISVIFSVSLPRLCIKCSTANGECQGDQPRFFRATVPAWKDADA